MNDAGPVLAQLPLDEHGHLRFSARHRPEGVELELALPEATRNELLPRLLARLGFTCDGEPVLVAAQSNYLARGQLATSERPAELLRVALSGQPFAEWEVGKPPRLLLPAITTSELRQLGEFPRFAFYPRQPGMALPLLESDFHTHSSGELSGADSMAIAREHGVPYPVRLLRALGVEEAELPATRTTTPRIVFPPLMSQEAHLPMMEEAVSLDELSPKLQARLAAAMDAPFDHQVTFHHMESELYRYRTPITKPASLIGPTQDKIAANYRDAGIHYAEITMTSPDKPEALRAVHDAVPLAKARHGVDLRYLVGIPRTYQDGQLAATFARARELMASPYIMGIDIIGYETNKTADMMHHLEDFADWCHAGGHSEATIRAHAGENSKNPDNVFHMLQLADRKNIRVRIGHAVYGLDDKALELAEMLTHRGLVVIEFNPPSNIALNNVDQVGDIPFLECSKRGLHFIVSKDGSGIMNATSPEVALQMHASGLGRSEFQAFKTTEARLIARQRAYSDEKLSRLQRDFAEFPDDASGFVAHLGARVAALPVPPPSTAKSKTIAFTDDPVLARGVRMVSGGQRKLRGKLPFLLVGASGTSWADVDPPAQEEAAIAIDMLTQTLDPEKIYFVQGRPKREGVTRQLASSLSTLGRRGFSTLGLITETHLGEHLRQRQEIAPNVTHLERIDGTLLEVARALVSIAESGGPVEGVQRKGIVVAAGGKAFTRDIILEASHHHLPLYLMSWVPGASQDKAAVMDPVHATADARSLVSAIHARYPSLFSLDLTPERLDATHEEARRRVHKAWAIDTHSDQNALQKWNSRRGEAARSLI